MYTENTYAKKQEDEERQLQEGGIGLRNAQRRLALLYPDQHDLIIKELEQRYIVNLSIQLKQEL